LIIFDLETLGEARMMTIWSKPVFDAIITSGDFGRPKMDLLRVAEYFTRSGKK
jgi:hypothetical protein